MSYSEVPLISVVVYAYQHAHFITRALKSLQAQTLTRWEACIVDDGSTDHTKSVVAPFLSDPRFKLIELAHPQGLGAALNIGLDQTQAQLIAYLPADDIYYQDHLATLLRTLQLHPEMVLAYSGMTYNYNRQTPGLLDTYPLQLVQVLHHRTSQRWTTQAEYVTDDLATMFWSKLGSSATFIGSQHVSCEWVDHPQKWHKIIQEPVGGINLYRTYYRVKEPLSFRTTTGNAINESHQYRRYRGLRLDAKPQGLKIVLVGELAYNADRIIALAEQGHRLYGLWMKEPYWYNTVGPLPFGVVQDMSPDHWREEMSDIQPDLIYALLNWQAVPWAHHILRHNPGIPFVWHFKEGPFICREQGTWNQLIDLYTEADGAVYSSPEMSKWFAEFIQPRHPDQPTLILDGDLPKSDWFDVEPSPLLSAQDGEIHTVVPGRPIGLHPHTVAELAQEKIHLHFYGNFIHGQWREWIEKTKKVAGRYFHLHDNLDQDQWVKEFSQYDAGWLHFFASQNQGELRRANWDDLNYPARLATLLVSGLPVLQRDNTGHVVATQTIVRELSLGLFFTTMTELSAQLRDNKVMTKMRHNVWQHRQQFMFDYHVPRLEQFFHRVINRASSSEVPAEIQVGGITAPPQFPRLVCR